MPCSVHPPSCIHRLRVDPGENGDGSGDDGGVGGTAPATTLPNSGSGPMNGLGGGSAVYLFGLAALLCAGLGFGLRRRLV